MNNNKGLIVSRATIPSFGLVLLLLVVLAFAQLSVAASSEEIKSYMPVAMDNAGGGANISWTPIELEVSLFPGTSTPVDLSFVSSVSITDVSISISPDIAPFLSIDATEIESVQAGTTYDLVAEISIPNSTLIDNYTGAVQIMTAGTEIPSELELSVQVAAPADDTIPTEPALPSEDRISSNDNYSLVNDEIVLALDFDTQNPSSRVKEIASATGGKFLGSIPSLFVYQVQYEVSDIDDLENLRQVIEGYEDVDFAALNYLVEQLATFPDDSQYDGHAWDENDPIGRNWGLEFIKAPSAWDINTGSSDVMIATVDWDIDASHEDLNENIVHNPFGRVDYGGHGTRVAGVICAEGNNDQGIAGVAWDCSLSTYNIREHNTPTTSIVWTIFQAVNEDADKGLLVVNLSLGETFGCESPPTEEARQKVESSNDIFGQAIRYAEEFKNREVLWVIAAGNDGCDVRNTSPASIVDDLYS